MKLAVNGLNTGLLYNNNIYLTAIGFSPGGTTDSSFRVYAVCSLDFQFESSDNTNCKIMVHIMTHHCHSCNNEPCFDVVWFVLQVNIQATGTVPDLQALSALIHPHSACYVSYQTQFTNCSSTYLR
jgi:hypothetical protein